MGTLAAENLVEFVADIDIKNLGVPPLGPGMLFLDIDTCAEGGGGVFFFLPWFFFPFRNHPWMDDGTNGWIGQVIKKLHEKTTTLSFTICNIYPWHVQMMMFGIKI